MAPTGGSTTDGDLISARRMIEVDHARVGGDWWDTPTATVLVDLAKVASFVVALAGIVAVLREGLDPLWVVGPAPDEEPRRDRSRIGLPSLRPAMCMLSPVAGFAVAQEWVDAGVDPAEVADWLRAGCWSAKAARDMVDAGIRPWRLLDENREPAHMVDVGPDGPIPLAHAVADKCLTPHDAITGRRSGGGRAPLRWPLVAPGRRDRAGPGGLRTQSPATSCGVDVQGVGQGLRGLRSVSTRPGPTPRPGRAETRSMVTAKCHL